MNSSYHDLHDNQTQFPEINFNSSFYNSSGNATSVPGGHDLNIGDGVFVHPYWKQYQEVIENVSPSLMFALGTYITIVAFIGIIGNLTVIWIFSTTASLKTPSNMFVINLAISDFMFSAIIGFPMMAIACFRRAWIWGDAACQWYAFIAGLSGLLSINTLTAISVDRFFVITRPLQMMHAASTKRSLQHIAFVWIYALAWTTAPWYGWGRYIPEGFGISCTWDYLTRTPNNISFNSCFVIFQFVIPVSTIIMCYSGMVMAVAKNRKQMSGMSNENSAQQKQEIKIAKVVAVNVFMFILSWLPYTTVAMLGISGHDQYVTPYTTEMPVMLAKASGAWNPIIYALSHPRYREALFKSSLPFKYFMKRDVLTKSESYSNVTRGSEISASVVDRSTRGETPTKHAAVTAVSASTQPEKSKPPQMMMESKKTDQPEEAGHDNESFTTHV